MTTGEDTNKSASTSPVIKVRVEKGKAAKAEFYFKGSFQIGRSPDCDILIMEKKISRFHAKVFFKDNQWWIIDLESDNGVWVDGVKIKRSPLHDNVKVALGQSGAATLIFNMEESKPISGDSIRRTREAQEEARATERQASNFANKTASDKINQPAVAAPHDQQGGKSKQKKTHRAVVFMLAVIFIVAGAYAAKEYHNIQEQKEIARDVFYSMKSIELELSKSSAEAKKNKDAREQQDAYKNQLKVMEENYNQAINSLKIYESKAVEKKLILKIARAFGECEVNMPAGFSDEVLKYIQKWKKTNKLDDAILLAVSNGYIPKIINAMKKYDLPPQFIYLAAYKSGLDVDACGPETEFGIAKGAWQIMPATAKEYGLQIGRLQEKQESDAGDDRRDFSKSTECAAKYLRDIYNTDAQASGLLAIVAYNRCQAGVIDLIKKMPQNPKERNFWCFLQKYKTQIPAQIYDEVFYIFSAAVIGENPRLFGFHFDNPLK